MHFRFIIAAFLLVMTTQMHAWAQDGTERAETNIPVQLQWKVCNETSFVLETATVMVEEGKPADPLTVRGWIKLYPGACQFIPAEKGTPRYIYARSKAVHQGGIREWKGASEYCVGEGNFTAKTDIDCAGQNMTPRKFLRVIPTEHRTAFVEPANYGSKAETAGIQRLLQDNNYQISRIDGFDGRRTSNTLKQFFKDKQLSTDLSGQAVLAVLEATALEVRASIGLTFCNESTANVWSAIAYKGEKGPESRGWWLIAPSTCVQPLLVNLKPVDLYYYARQETEGATDNILNVSGQGRDYCIGEGRFSVIRHEFCKDQGYISARFQPVPSGQSGVRVVFKDANFGTVLASVPGP